MICFIGTMTTPCASTSNPTSESSPLRTGSRIVSHISDSLQPATALPFLLLTGASLGRRVKALTIYLILEVVVMILRGALIQRDGHGKCGLFTNRTLSSNIAKLLSSGVLTHSGTNLHNVWPLVVTSDPSVQNWSVSGPETVPCDASKMLGHAPAPV